MKILIRKNLVKKGKFIVSIFAPDTDYIVGGEVTLNDEAHLNLGEVEAKARADALRAVTGWPVVCEYE